MAAHVTNEIGEYAELLRQAIEAKSSRRKLSFALAERTGNQQPSEYRSLGKYLAGDEFPARERAATLAVLLGEPQLAIVPDLRDRRRDRLAELEEEVGRLREERETALQAIVVRLAELEADLVNAGLRSDRRPTATSRRK